MADRSDPTDRLMPKVPQAARWLGLSGLIPFFGLALACWVTEGETQGFARQLLTAYGALVLSFLGGCRWGFATGGLGKGPELVPMVVSVLPSLFAWVVMFTGHPQAFFYLATGFAALLGADLNLTREGGAPGWWPALRWPLTMGAVAALAAAGFS